MKSKFLWSLIGSVIIMVLVLTSCGTTPQPTTTAATTTPTTAKPTTTAPTTASTKPQTSTPTTAPTTVTPKSGIETPKYGGSMVIAGTQVFSSFSDLQAGNTCGYFLSFIYDKLYVGDYKKSPAGTGEWRFASGSWLPEQYRAPSLATSWELPDPQTIVFHLRQGVHFQNIPPVNGKEMTAADVVASFEWYKASKTHDNSLIRDLPDKITATDKYTVTITLKQLYFDPVAPFTAKPRNFIHSTDMINLTKGDLTDWKNAVGTGPFIVTDFVRDSSISFKKNPDYWGHDEFFPQNQLPYVDKVNWLMIVDWSTMLSALRTGKIDYVRDVSPEDAHSLISTSPELQKSSVIDLQGRPKITLRIDLKPFSDLRVRKAISMAIDRDTIIKEYLQGEGIALSWPMSASWGEDLYTPPEKLPAAIRELYEYHPDKAKQLLTEAGFPNGFDTEVLTTGVYSERTQILTGYWAKVGIKAKIRVVEQAAYTSEIYGRKYPAMCSANAGQSDPPTTLNYYVTGSYYNYGEGSYPYYDEVVTKILATIDPVARNKMCKDINVWFLENCINFAFPAQNIYVFWQPWIKNFHGENGLGPWLYGAMAARNWVDQDLKKSMGR